MFRLPFVLDADQHWYPPCLQVLIFDFAKSQFGFPALPAAHAAARPFRGLSAIKPNKEGWFMIWLNECLIGTDEVSEHVAVLVQANIVSLVRHSSKNRCQECSSSQMKGSDVHKVYFMSSYMPQLTAFAMTVCLIWRRGNMSAFLHLIGPRASCGRCFLAPSRI